jgi:hypothetical protein
MSEEIILIPCLAKAKPINANAVLKQICPFIPCYLIHVMVHLHLLIQLSRNAPKKGLFISVVSPQPGTPIPLPQIRAQASEHQYICFARHADGRDLFGGS